MQRALKIILDCRCLNKYMPHWTEAIRRLQQLKADLTKIAGSEMVSYALDNIRKETWEGRRWQRRKPGTRRDSGRGLLVDTGEGRRSIEYAASGTQANLTVNEYMQAHNEGVRRPVTVRNRGGGTHTRNMNLPQRQFAGKSKELDSRIASTILKRIIKALT
jgi:hypothetical protein